MEETKRVIEYKEPSTYTLKESMPLFKKFCWPGLIMPQFWGICNGLPIGMAAFIPVIFPIIAIYFGVAGYQLSYESRPIGKKEFFDKQVKWRKGAIVYFSVMLCIFLAVSVNSLVNYVTNKTEIKRLVMEYERSTEQLEKDLETLLDEKYLDAIIGEHDYEKEDALELNDNSQLWNLENNYNYAQLSERILEFEKPLVISVSQDYIIENGEKIWIFFDIDENFQIREAKYYVFSDEEVHQMMEGSGVLLYDERWKPYMDKITMESIIGKKHG